jgi:hypothetical protein
MALRPGIERRRLSSFHVGHVAGQENDRRATASTVAVGEAEIVADLEAADFCHERALLPGTGRLNRRDGTLRLRNSSSSNSRRRTMRMGLSLGTIIIIIIVLVIIF